MIENGERNILFLFFFYTNVEILISEKKKFNFHC